MENSINKKLNKFSEPAVLGVRSKLLSEKLNKTDGKTLVLESLFNSFMTEVSFI